MICNDITELIGGTPLLRIDPAVHQLSGVELYAKLELLNPFGSVKDRVAWGMLQPRLDQLVVEGQHLIEASSGNTAKALQLLVARHGIGLQVISNRVKVPEIRDLLLLLGAELEELPGLSECPDPTAPVDAFTVIEQRQAAEPGRLVHLSQYTNPDNVATHHRTTGQEIVDDLDHVDYLIGAVGTAGSTTGTANRLREEWPDLATIGVVSDASDHIPGIRSEAELWEVGLFEQAAYDEILAVNAQDAIDGTLDLIRRSGIPAGPTSGATYRAARRHLAGVAPAGNGRPIVAVFIACDRVEPYLTYLRDRRPEAFGASATVTAARMTTAELDQVPLVTPDDLDRPSPTPLLLIDTRGSMAFRTARVPGSVNIRDDRLVELAGDGQPFPPPLRVVLICPVGTRAVEVAVVLRRAGADAAVLDGGFLAWRLSGRAVERGSGPAGPG